MSKLTAEEILQKVKNSGFEVATFAEDDACWTSEFSMTGDGLHLTSDWKKIDSKWEEFKASLGGFKTVEQYGGEGQGDTWFSVKYFPTHDIYIRTDGFYQSYNGVEFYSGYGYEVKPEQKTITVYNKV